MSAPSVEQRPDRALSPLQRVWLEIADARQRRQHPRVALLAATLRGLAKAGAR